MPSGFNLLDNLATNVPPPDGDAGSPGPTNNPSTDLMPVGTILAASSVTSNGSPSPGGGGAGAASFSVSTQGSGLVFSNTIIGNYTSAALTAFENDITAAEDYLEAEATNSATIHVDFAAVNQGANGDGADNSFLLYGYSYSTLRSALLAQDEKAGNTYGNIAAQYLPAADPTGGGTFYIPTSYARMLGLGSAVGGTQIVNGQIEFSTSLPYDDSVILNTNYVSDYGQDAIDAITHELSEGSLGRIGGLGDTLSDGTVFYSTEDLFRYNAAGQLDDSNGRDGRSVYFSYNGGQTNSGAAGLAFNNQFNTASTQLNQGDVADWTDSSSPDIFGDVSSVLGLSATDDEILGTLGWVPLPSTITVAYFEANRATLDQIPGGFQVTDTAANIFNGLGNLEADASNITKITATDMPVQVGVNQFTPDETILNKIAGGFAISDTAANIFNGLGSLEADAADITTITATDTPVQVGVGKFTPDETILNKIAGGFAFVGQASAIQGDLDAIEADIGHINSITAQNGTVTVPVATFLNDLTALNKIAGGFAISDTAANIFNGLGSLEADAGNISGITATDVPVQVGVSKFTLDETVLNKIAGGFAISDTAANIFNGLGLLEADAGNIASVTATDTRVQVGVGKFTPDEAVLNKVAGGFDILGLSASIGASFDALEADVSHIGIVSFADASPVLNLTQTQATNDASLLAKIVSSYVENVSNAGATTTTGHGNALTITAVAGGNDTINGTGTSESFVFGANFGVDTVVDFSAHLASPGNDTITLPASEFTDFNTMFSNDTTFSGGNAIIQSGGDKLTIDNINSATLQANQANFHFA